MSLAYLGHNNLFGSSNSSNSSATIEELDELPEILPDECYVANVNIGGDLKPQLPFQSKRRRRKHKKSEHEEFCKNENSNSNDVNNSTTSSTTNTKEILKDVLMGCDRNLTGTTTATDSVCSSREAVFGNSAYNSTYKRDSFSTSRLSSIVSSIIAKEKEKDMEKEVREDDDGNVGGSDTKNGQTSKERIDQNGISHYRNESNHSVNSDSTCSCCKSDDDDGEDGDDDEEDDDNLPNLLQSEEYRTNFLKRRFQKAVRRVHMLNRWKSYSLSHSALDTTIL